MSNLLVIMLFSLSYLHQLFLILIQVVCAKSHELLCLFLLCFVKFLLRLELFLHFLMAFLQCSFFIFDNLDHPILFFFLALGKWMRVHKVLALTHGILQILGWGLVVLQPWWFSQSCALVSIMILQSRRLNFVTSLYVGFLLVGHRKGPK